MPNSTPNAQSECEWMANATPLSQREAIRRIEDYKACDVLTDEAAQAIADAWGVDLSRERMGEMSAVTPLFTGENGFAIAVSELVIEILRGLGIAPRTPTLDGAGLTARARYEQNLPLLYDHMDLELDHEPGASVYADDSCPERTEDG